MKNVILVVYKHFFIFERGYLSISPRLTDLKERVKQKCKNNALLLFSLSQLNVIDNQIEKVVLTLYDILYLHCIWRS